MKQLVQILLYAGFSKTVYENAIPEMAASNRKNMGVFLRVAFLAMAAMVLVSFFVESLVKLRLVYGICAAVFILLYLLLIGPLGKKNTGITILTYIFFGILMAFGIVLGACIMPNELSVTFCIMLFAIPLLVYDSPIRMILAIVITQAAYLLIAHFTMTPQMFSNNASNVLPYGMISMVVSTYMMQIKVERIILDQENKFLSGADQLTGLLNRRSYEQHIERLRKKGCEEILVCALDVNGLKNINDTMGHNAGDELILGAAVCIREVFGDYGRCYRIGGDEFMIFIESAHPPIQELAHRLCRVTAEWKGELVQSVSLSMGMAAGKKGQKIEDLIHQADLDMYQSKADYYKNSGFDRRKYRG